MARRPAGDGASRRGAGPGRRTTGTSGALFNYLGDAQNTFPVWNATPLVALDVYEHAYFLDYQTDRASYVDAFFENLDWHVVNGWIASYSIPF